MAQLTITIPDVALQRVLAAFAANFGYRLAVPDPANPGQTIPNPQTLAAFAQEQVRLWVKGIVKNHEGKTALLKAHADVDSQLTLS